MKEKWKILDNTMTTMEGNDIFGVGAMDMCLVSDLTILAKFKTLEFKKYRCRTCPRIHMVMYYRNMAAHTNVDKRLIHCFQDSLSEASLKWYVGLEKICIHNMDMDHDRK